MWRPVPTGPVAAGPGVRYSPAVTRTRLEAAIALVLFGCIPVVVKSISANPYTIGIFRLVIATAGIAILAGVRHELRAVSIRDLQRLMVIGVLFFGHWITYFLAIKVSSASIAAIGLSTYGVHLLLLGAIFGIHRLNASDVLAVLAAAGGAALVVPVFKLDNAVAMGMLLSTLSALMYASLPLLHQRWSHLPTTTRALGQFGFALFFFLLQLPQANWTLRPFDWAGLVFLALGPTLIAHSLWVRVTTRIPPALTSIIYYANIPIAIALGVVLLHEPLGLRTVLGAALIIGGSIFGLVEQWRSTRSDSVATPG